MLISTAAGITPIMPTPISSLVGSSRCGCTRKVRCTCCSMMKTWLKTSRSPLLLADSGLEGQTLVLLALNSRKVRAVGIRDYLLYRSSIALKWIVLLFLLKPNESAALRGDDEIVSMEFNNARPIFRNQTALSKLRALPVC